MFVYTMTLNPYRTLHCKDKKQGGGKDKKDKKNKREKKEKNKKGKSKKKETKEKKEKRIAKEQEKLAKEKAREAAKEQREVFNKAKKADRCVGTPGEYSSCLVRVSWQFCYQLIVSINIPKIICTLCMITVRIS